LILFDFNFHTLQLIAELPFHRFANLFHLLRLWKGWRKLTPVGRQVENSSCKSTCKSIRSRSMIMKIPSTFCRLSLIAAISTLMFACTKPGTADNPVNAAPAPTANASNSTFPAQNPEAKIARIKADEAKRLVAEEKAIIIDVRGTEAYKQTHIKGSLDIPLGKLETGDFAGLPKDKIIIAYCTCGAEQTSSRAAALLEKAGFKNTGALLGGLSAWQSAGGQVEKSAQ
jgi:phage shock protein E